MQKQALEIKPGGKTLAIKIGNNRLILNHGSSQSILSHGSKQYPLKQIHNKIIITMQPITPTILKM